MTRQALILRPEPGAAQTEAAARAKGLDPIVAPIFEIASLDWEPPLAAEVDAVLLTSANAPRTAGSGLAAFLHLPCYAVGEATAAAASEAGFRDARTGPSDAAALLRMVAEDGLSSVFHPHGRDHISPRHPGLTVVGRAVYEAKAVDSLPTEAVAALKEGTLVLLHSPRAAGHFARLFEVIGMAKGDIDLALISEAAAMAAGPDWKSVSVAAAPRDHALLELAAKLCKD